ncbi:MAG: WYL domain-containing protein, partial [Lachnospiraceae bacterium]|nr:WYL domain-containing protein [Lachnospiraceae bacterium]
MVKNDKTYRILSMYDKLSKGKILYKGEEANYYQVNEKSIQRDIEDIREYLDTQPDQAGGENRLVYDHRQHGYRLERADRMMLSNEEVLAVTKILLDSRAFTKAEMMDMLDRLVACCVPPENCKLVNELISNERHHYIELQHKKVFMDKMWDIGTAIHEARTIEIEYERTDHKVVNRKVQPLAVMFSEFYFYMAANIENIDREKAFQNADDKFPTIYRIDRIQNLKVLEEHYKIPYKDRFEEGEYRKRIQFMQGGRLQRTEFWYQGVSVEAVLDSLPTAKNLEEEDGRYLISAETFGNGIEMWLRS